MAEFRFRRFSVDDCGCGQKVCTDSVLLAAWFARKYVTAQSVADIGTGSGVLALICAELCPQASVTAIEIDPAACVAARHNFEASPWADRLHLVEEDFEEVDFEAELIISNPPYFANGLRAPEANRALARHEGKLNYETLIRKAAESLTDNGHLGLVSPADRMADILFAAELAGLKLCRSLHVAGSVSKPPTRILWDFARSHAGTPQTALLRLRKEDGTPSDEYRALVGELYLKL